MSKLLKPFAPLFTLGILIISIWTGLKYIVAPIEKRMDRMESRLEKKIDGVESRLEKKIDSLKEDMNRKLDQLILQKITRK